MNLYTSVAKEIAAEVGKEIRFLYYRVLRFSPSQKADDATFAQFFSGVETMLANEVARAYPHHSINGQYIEGYQKEERHQWYISAVGGEENFRLGSAHFSLSMAYEVDGKLQSAVIYNPITEELYHASRSDGAIFNDQRLRVTSDSLEMKSVGALTHFSKSEAHQERINKAVRSLLSLRVLGDLALDAGEVMKGNYHAYFASDVDLYAAKAAALIATEAGLLVTDFKGAENRGEGETLLIVHPRLLRPFLSFLR